MPDSKTYTYQSMPVNYHQLGEGKPLIVLHGWGSSSSVMMPLAKQLSHLRECFVLDLPGFGDTPEPSTSWHIDDYADMIESFIKDKFDEPVDLLAHSFGGRITLKLCARPSGKERIDKVLITGGAGMKPRRSASYYVKKYTAKLLKAPFLILPSKQREKALDWLRNTSAWKALGSSEYAELSGVMRETFVKSVTEHLESCLPAIPHEVLLLWGRDDNATPLYQGERMEAGIKNAALVVIDNAGHYAFLDRPKHFASIAEAFFKD
ncbi:MAG: alpha/beta hydrolase [Balneolaceae bacterium]|nr:alpha/beta hydrolase [Balneolaceae bacterium]